MEKFHETEIKKIWSFIGRNRLFAVFDIVMVTDIDEETVTYLCGLLEQSRHLEKTEEDGQYRCVNYTGKSTPVITANEMVVDTNVAPKKDVKKRDIDPTMFVLKVILDYPKEHFTKREIWEASGRHYRPVFEVLDKLLDDGVIEVAVPRTKGKSQHRLSPAVKTFCSIYRGAWTYLLEDTK